MNKQREVIYAERKMVLEGKDLKEHITKMIDDVLNIQFFFIVLKKYILRNGILKGLFEWAKIYF